MDPNPLRARAFSVRAHDPGAAQDAVNPKPGPTHPAAPFVQAGVGSAAPDRLEASRDGAAPGAPAAGTRLTRAEIERVRLRDPEALGMLFERYFDQVFGLIYRLLGERAVAEDLTQDVFLKVHRAAPQLDPARDPGPWLTAIAYNACRDLWRSGAHRMARRSAPVDGVSEAAVQLTRGTNDPERDALRAERERLVQDAIRRLPEALRVPIVLHDYQGMGHQEIAELLGVNHAAARKRYSRALAALGEILAETLA